MAGYSALAFGRDLLRTGQLDLWSLQPELFALRLDSSRDSVSRYSALLSVLGGLLVGAREDELFELGERLFESDYQDRLHPEAFVLVESHRSRGHALVIASAATIYQARPIARAFGISDVLCSRFETFAGRLTGTVAEACWAEGKLAAVERFTQRRGIDLQDCFVYSDGFEDVPVLEACGHPSPTNPDDRLAEHAAARGWEPLRFGQVSAPTAWEVVRPMMKARKRPTLREQIDRFVDRSIRLGYRTAHWIRRSL